MPSRIAVTTLNASTMDILNVIRANASYEYQSLVPEVDNANMIPKVGEVLFGYPALANQFINSLVNRIALVRVKSATFNNAYAELKKGYLEFGETVEEVFVEIAKAREFNPEKAEARQMKRSLPDVRTAFHAKNWRVQYPITIQQEDLRAAFLSMNGVQDLIAKIVDQVFTANEYDEFLLFKYLMIKAISHGKMYPVAIDSADPKAAAKAFRATSGDMTFIKTKFNQAGVHTSTRREDQRIFMDTHYEAEFDVEVLSAAFHMDKAEYFGKRMLMDNWAEFDNDRFAEIRANCDMIEEVTEDELALMANVKAVLVDQEWFQVYDNLAQMTENYIGSGMYWNYWYNVWKTISSSPFSNAVVFVDNAQSVALPGTFDVEITNMAISEAGTIVTVELAEDTPVITGGNLQFVQTQTATEQGVAVHKYGAYILPPNVAQTTPVVMVNGEQYTGTSINTSTNKVGDTITFTKG